MGPYFSSSTLRVSGYKETFEIHLRGQHSNYTANYKSSPITFHFVIWTNKRPKKRPPAASALLGLLRGQQPAKSSETCKICPFRNYLHFLDEPACVMYLQYKNQTFTIILVQPMANRWPIPIRRIRLEKRREIFSTKSWRKCTRPEKRPINLTHIHINTPEQFRK